MCARNVFNDIGRKNAIRWTFFTWRWLFVLTTKWNMHRKLLNNISTQKMWLAHKSQSTGLNLNNDSKVWFFFSALYGTTVIWKQQDRCEGAYSLCVATCTILYDNSMIFFLSFFFVQCHLDMCFSLPLSFTPWFCHPCLGFKSYLTPLLCSAHWSWSLYGNEEVHIVLYFIFFFFFLLVSANTQLCVCMWMLLYVFTISAWASVFPWLMITDHGLLAQHCSLPIWKLIVVVKFHWLC